MPAAPSRTRTTAPARTRRAGRPAARAAQRPPRVGFVSLGCPKALVDSERILTQLRAEGYEIAPSYQTADLVVVNTCGFIDAAVDESLDTIGEALAHNGCVIVTGCLGAKPERILARHPSVLEVTGPQAYEEVVAAVHAQLPPQHHPFFDLLPPQGVRLTPRHYAYLKVAEGCNNKCSFCIIPSMRGRLRSRRIDEVLGEAERLVTAGVKELLVIAQDTSAYGADIRYAGAQWRGAQLKTRFLDLARALGELAPWVRLHYVYPYPHVDAVIELMATNGVLPYLDVPFQHGAPEVLKRMRRPAHAEDTLARIRAWRRTCPKLTLRSTFIVGFPGESEAEFAELLAWLEEAQLDRVGCFKYSPVEGATANALSGHVPPQLQEERYARFMERAAAISTRRLKARIGERTRVLVDSVADGVVTARSAAEAPEIDGVIRIVAGEKNITSLKAGEKNITSLKAGEKNITSLKAGEWADVEIVAADAYDLTGHLTTL